MAVALESVSFASPGPELDARFWAAVLDRPLVHDRAGILLPGRDGQVGLRFVTGLAHGPAMNRLHAHLSEGPGRQAENIATAVRLGARLRGNGHVPVGDYAAMATPSGDEFCAIEDGNAYLAGCGPLGEITCEGSRAVGLFWSRALGWPLVWDEGEETAIQPAPGGTKLAWSGEAPRPEVRDGRQSFVLTVSADERDAEIERMTRLGAVPVASGADGEETLADPDGVAFVVRMTEA